MTSRRNFLRQLSLISASIAGFLAFISLLRQAIPWASLENRRIKIGNTGRFPINTFTYIPDHNIYVYRDPSGIKAVSAICTHLGCIVEKTEDGFQCPCHGSCFNEKGEVLSGAASKGLPWYHIYKDVDGQIIVDLRTIEGPEYRLTVS